MLDEDYYQDGKQWWFRFREKGGKQHQVPAHESPRTTKQHDSTSVSISLDDIERILNPTGYADNEPAHLLSVCKNQGTQGHTDAHVRESH